MKYGLELQKLRQECEAIGEARGELKSKLSLAQEMLDTSDDFEFIAKIYKLPVEYVQALHDNCTIEAIMEQYFEHE